MYNDVLIKVEFNGIQEELRGYKLSKQQWDAISQQAKTVEDKKDKWLLDNLPNWILPID